MFKIIHETQNDLERVKILNTITDEYVSIIPKMGANINEIVLKKENKLYSVLEGKKSKEEFDGMNIYNSAVLFPFPNRVENGRYEFEEKSYQLPINHPAEGHALHGFVCDKTFEIIHQESSDSIAEIILFYEYDGSYPGYPFPFQMNIKYRLDEKGFSCFTEILNFGKDSMPMSEGWHPYFSFGGSVDNIQLQVPDADIIITDKLIPTGDKQPYTHFKNPETINENEFDTCFLLKSNKERYETKLINPDEQITVVLWQDKKYKYLQIYTPPERTSVALEPMTGNVNNFNNKEDLIILKTGEKINLSYGVELK